MVGQLSGDGAQTFVDVILVEVSAQVQTDVDLFALVRSPLIIFTW